MIRSLTSTHTKDEIPALNEEPLSSLIYTSGFKGDVANLLYRIARTTEYDLDFKGLANRISPIIRSLDNELRSNMMGLNIGKIIKLLRKLLNFVDKEPSLEELADVIQAAINQAAGLSNNESVDTKKIRKLLDESLGGSSMVNYRQCNESAPQSPRLSKLQRVMMDAL